MYILIGHISITRMWVLGYVFWEYFGEHWPCYRAEATIVCWDADENRHSFGILLQRFLRTASVWVVSQRFLMRDMSLPSCPFRDFGPKWCTLAHWSMLSDAIWPHASWSTLVKLRCVVDSTPNRYLNQYQLVSYALRIKRQRNWHQNRKMFSKQIYFQPWTLGYEWHQLECLFLV